MGWAMQHQSVNGVDVDGHGPLGTPMPKRGSPDPRAQLPAAKRLAAVHRVLGGKLAHLGKFGVGAAYPYPTCASSPTTPRRRAHRHASPHNHVVAPLLLIFSFTEI